MRAVLSTLFLSSLAGVVAQDLTIPSTWLNPTFNLSRASRENLANRAAAALLAQVNPAGGTSDDLPHVQDITGVFSVLALQDYYSGNSSWKDFVSNGVQAYYQQKGLYGGLPEYNSDAIYWGLGFYYAYRTYRTPFLLDLAKSAYNATYTDGFITPSAASSGSGAGRNVSFSPPSGCSSGTIAGGVFWAKTVQNNTNINTETVAPFMALSAYLYEETSDSLYQQAAQLSLDFMVGHLWDGTIVQDGFDPATCATNNATHWTYDQAWFVEGLSVWANVTKNNTLTTLLQTVVPSVTSFSGWTLQDGVISEAPARDSFQATLKGIFIRGLSEARLRNPGTDLAKYIEAYITVQYNSLLNNALAPQTSYYTTSWFGPPNATFSAVGNLAALDVLNAAFSFVAPTPASPDSSESGNSTTTNSPHPTDTPASSSAPSNAGAVAGGVVGGVVGVAAAVAAFLLWRRRRDSAKRGHFIQEKFDGSDGGMTVEPFIHQTSPHDLPSTNLARPQAALPAISGAASTSGLLSSPVVTVGHPSKLQRMNAPYHDANAQAVAIRQPERMPSSAGESSSPGVAGPERVSLAEIPNLVRRLNNLLQGQPEELPPQYES
ncbi:unnamed protein product [Peniophora sp. CBMAI 1063]|nr:unnamed protein product [Peniophora sp. CBMAI 1063]